MNTKLVYEGGCSCRKVRYKLNAEPLIVHACHCRQCQRVTGSAFVLNALIEKTHVDQLSGNIRSFNFPDTCHTAFFCRVCATFVWSEYKSGRFDDCWFVRVGTLDEPQRAPPAVHIYVESKQPWVAIPDGIPKFEHFYRIKDVWGEISINRITAMRNKQMDSIESCQVDRAV